MKAPPKSILKKSSSLRTVEQHNTDVNIKVHDDQNMAHVVGSIERLSLQGGDSSNGNDLPSSPRPLSQLQKHHSSAPDLTQVLGPPGTSLSQPSPLRPAATQTICASQASLSKATSVKKLSFQLENVNVIPAHSKNDYNRKPPPNMTFQRLDNKLRMEIR